MNTCGAIVFGLVLLGLVVWGIFRASKGTSHDQ